jgi:competence protein ComEC
VVHRDRPRAALTLLAVACLVAARGVTAWAGIDRSPLGTAVVSGQRVAAEVTLVGDPAPGRFTARVVARVRSWGPPGESDRADAGSHVLVVASRGVSSPVLASQAGDRLAVVGRLEPLAREGPDARWRRQHVAARLSLEEVTDAAGPATAVHSVANSIRAAILAGLDGLPPVERGLVAGFLVGDTRGVPDHVTEQFRAAGLSHLLVVSGSNVAFVLALVGPALRRRGLTGRLAGAVVTITLFAAVTRFEPSVLRASATTGLAAVAASLGRPTSGLRLLGLAVTGLLVVDPLLVHSLAFRLSCGASLGILVLAPGLRRRLPGPRWTAELAAVTGAAQVGVAPVLIPAFGSVPLVAVPANVLAGPLAAPLTAWGMLAGLASGLVAPILPAGAAALQVPTLLLVRGVAALADAGSRVRTGVGPGAAAGGLVVATLVVATLIVGIRARSHRLDGHARAAGPADP